MSGHNNTGDCCQRKVVTHPMCVNILASSVHVLANPKSHSLSMGGSLLSNRVLSNFKSLQACSANCRHDGNRRRRIVQTSASQQD